MTCFLTRRCNARCPYCFYLSDQGDQVFSTPEMTTDELRRVSASLGSLLWLAFSGGEVFLRRDLVDIVTTFYTQNRPAIILLPTNGLDRHTIVDRTEAILQRCPGSTIVVKLSLDGPPHVHDAVRNLKGGFAETMHTCEALGELLHQYDNFELGINSVFSATSRKHLPAFIDEMQDLAQIQTHTVSLVRGRTWHNRPPELESLLDEYGAVIMDLERRLRTQVAATYRFRGSRLKAAQDILQRRFILQTATRQKRLLPCYAGRLNLVLAENGDVYPCESFEEPMRLGNVRESGCDLNELMRSAKAEQVLADIASKRCYCTHECYMMTNILFNPCLYPRLLREYWQLFAGSSRRHRV